ncbi:hypothetical protein CYMTET_25595 [Cymbomonas tetramitiformis]|uniref:Uncharacterized protein n=1 Tax=Cymbomonas tetramitiformis TaxID=36881 RepID=A0AAE0FTJ0_9CHLO|nr:hypothetical protein CYMTET_25595 [Cymbomonas tetramitiformis]
MEGNFKVGRVVVGGVGPAPPPARPEGPVSQGLALRVCRSTRALRSSGARLAGRTAGIGAPAEGGGVRRALARQYGGGAPEATPAYTPLRAPPGLSDEPPRASPPGTPSPARVSGAEPVSELALSSTLRQPARRKRASPGALAPAASASSESDSDRSAKGLNPSAAPFSPPPASSRSAGSRLVRQEPMPEPVTPSLSPLVGCEQGNLTSAPGRLEILPS